MGLLTIVRKLKQTEKEMRILMLGLDNAGKTTIVKKILGKDTSKISPTLGFNIDTIDYKQYKLNIWDVGGQSSIRSYWRNYFEATDALIFVIDSVDKDRLEICKQELKSLMKQERLMGTSLLVFANKQDLEGSLSLMEIKNLLELDDIYNHWHIEACSALTGQGLEKGIEWVVNDVSSRLFSLD
jgi:ADP-ribosylation factor-like protein 2